MGIFLFDIIIMYIQSCSLLSMFQGVVTNILPAVLTPMTEIKQSSCKIGDDQAIKMSICAVQMKVKMGPVL